MLTHSHRPPVLVPVLVSLLAHAASAQCLEWDTVFTGTGVGGDVHATLRFDEGGGEALYVGGDFDWVSGTPAVGVARWDGTGWTAMGAEIQGSVLALASYDDGSGPALYAGGNFLLSGVQNVDLAVWNGSAWAQVAPSVGALEIVELRVFDDGSGPVLYVAANFGTAGQGAVFAWDGQQLTQVGSTSTHVEALEVYDDGAGARLYAAVRPGGTTWQLLEWQGGTTWTNWEFVQGAGMVPHELHAHDLGSGPKLHVGGNFTSIGGVAAKGVAELGPVNWGPLGAGLEGIVFSLFTHDDGSGPALYAGGSLNASGPVVLENLARLNGNAWSQFGGTDGTVRVLGEDPQGDLVVGGKFTRMNDGLVNHLTRWDGAAWSALGVGHGFDGSVRAFEVFDDGGGPALYAGGVFEFAGVDLVDHIARWTGSGWTALGGGLDGRVFSMKAFDDGTGPALYVGGEFTDAGGLPATRIARWDGIAWEAAGAGFDDRVNALEVFDDGTGPVLYAAGEFTGRIKRWDGTQWNLFANSPQQPVNDMLAWDDGTGEALYVCGPIVQVGPLTTNGVVRWDGSAWSALGAGLGPNNKELHSLAVWDDGSGERLFAGGNFTKSGAATIDRIAAWDGVAWSQVGAVGFNADVRAMEVFDDGGGGGEALYVTGDFNSIMGITTTRLARWDGASWSAVGAGLNGDGQTLRSFDDGSGKGPSLWIGGDFIEADGAQSSYVARYSNPCPQVGVNYCTAGTSTSGCQAIMSASGTPSATAPSGFFFQVDGLEGQKTGLFLWAANGKQANSWGNGTSFICVIPPRYRSAVLGPSGTQGLCDGSETTDMNARWTFKPNSNPGAGAVTQAQFWYRDPQNTSNQTSGLSDGLEFTVGP